METELLADLFYGPARILQGSGLDDDELVLTVTEAFGNRAFCIVRNWMLVDVILTDRHDTLIRQNGLQPTVLYANTVVCAGDVTEVMPSGVLSSFLVSYDGCFVETADMYYVLAGRGARKDASVWAISALAQQCGSKFEVDDGR